MYDIQTIQDAIDSKTRDTQRLLDTYGSGVRPAWVSTDIAINESQIAHYRRLLAVATTAQKDE